MPTYEYKVVPAPAKGVKVKAARTTAARFSHALVTLMNELGREGWEYQRAETLPCEERSALGSRSTSYQNVLVFRRLLQEDTITARKLELTASNSDDAAPTKKVRASKSDNAGASSAPKISPFGAPSGNEKPLKLNAEDGTDLNENDAKKDD